MQSSLSNLEFKNRLSMNNCAYMRFLIQVGVNFRDMQQVLTNIWKSEFTKKWEEISKQGFDLTFKRMWNFYLSYCEAGFKSKNIDLIQFSLQNK